MKRVIGSTFLWIFYTFMFVLMFICILIAFLFSFPFDQDRKLPNWVFLTMGRTFFGINPFWKLHIHGFEHWNNSKKVILVSNHQSFMDMPLHTYLPCKVKWISKKSLFKIPFMGWSMTLSGHIRIDRNKRTSVKGLEQQVTPLIENNVPVLIFPEGTRSEKGSIKSFKNGAFDFAHKHHWLIQPIILDGTYRMLPSGDWRFNLKEDIYLSMLEAIDPDQFKSRDEIKEYTHNVMKEELERIRMQRPEMKTV